MNVKHPMKIYLEPCQVSMMKLFLLIADGF